MYPEYPNNQLHRSRSISHAPTAPKQSNVAYQRAVSEPYASAAWGQDDEQNDHYQKIDNLLEAIKADIDGFVHLYPSVWNVILPPGVAVTLQLSDALRLLPETRGLATATSLTRSNLKLIQSMLASMATNLPFTINPSHVADHVLLDHVLHGHGQVGDLLTRARHEVANILALLDAWNPAAGTHAGQDGARFESPTIASARTVMAAAVVIRVFINSIQHNWDRIVV